MSYNMQVQNNCIALNLGYKELVLLDFIKRNISMIVISDTIIRDYNPLVFKTPKEVRESFQKIVELDIFSEDSTLDNISMDCNTIFELFEGVFEKVKPTKREKKEVFIPEHFIKIKEVWDAQGLPKGSLTDRAKTIIDYKLQTMKLEDIIEALSGISKVTWLQKNLTSNWFNLGWCVSRAEEFLEGGKYYINNTFTYKAPETVVPQAPVYGKEKIIDFGL